MKTQSNSNKIINFKLKNFSEKKIGIVKSCWNSLITDSLHSGCKNTLLKNGVKAKNIKLLEVPGSFELIYGAKKIHKQHKLDAIIVIGSIIKGETPHFEFISQAIANGVKDLNILFDIPFIFCVSTDLNLNQAKARSGGKLGNKGSDCANTALQLL